MPKTPSSDTRRRFGRWLRMLPFDTRRDYGREMEDVFLFEHEERSAEGRWAVGRLWAETIAGVLAFARREHWATTREDLRQAARGWQRAPGLFLVLVSTMTAGIAGVSVAFAVADAVLLRPLAVADPPSLVRIGERHPDSARLGNVTYATYLDLEPGGEAFAHVAAARPWFANLTGEGTPERFSGALVSGDFFDALGVLPARGRLLTVQDDQPGRGDVVVISDGVWRRRFGADESVLGRVVSLNGRAMEIAGVLPKGAEFPLGTEVWAPLVARASGIELNRRSHLLQVIARLSPQASPGDARGHLAARAASITREHPGEDPDLGLDMEPLLDRVVAPVRAGVWTALAAALVLLLVLGTNVAHVQLARTADRERELALRAVLGASRGRLARQLFTESVGLSMVASLPTILVSWLVVRGLPALLPPDLPRASGIVFSWRVALVGLAVGAVAGIVFGIWPALRSSSATWLSGSRTVGRQPSGPARSAPGSVLAAAQIAFAFVLLVVAGLVVRSAAEAANVPLGFTYDRLLRIDLPLSSGRVADPDDGDAYVAVLDPILRRLEALPGVERAAMTSTAPFMGGAATSFAVVGQEASPGREPVADVRIVDAGIFDVLGVPIVVGRGFTAGDGAGSRPVMVVSETLARRRFPDGRAVGRSITMLNWGPPLTAEVVGVVGDVAGQDPEADAEPTMYWHYPQFPQLFAITLFVRTATDEALLIPEVRQAIWGLEPDQPLPRIEPMAWAVRDARAQRRTLTVLLAALAVAAAAFALVGLYGLLAHKVGRERPVHGVRMALGATPMDIARLVVRDAGMVAAVGVGVGLALSLAAGPAIESLLFETTLTDVAAYAGAVGVIALTVAAAVLVPAWRASRTDPLLALRCQ